MAAVLIVPLNIIIVLKFGYQVKSSPNVLFFLLEKFLLDILNFRFGYLKFSNHAQCNILDLYE